MKWRPKNVFQSLTPLTTANAIIGLGIFHHPSGCRYPRFSLIYAIIATLLYYVAFGFAIDVAISKSSYGGTENVIFSIIYANVAIAGMAQILTWYHKNTCFCLITAMSKVDETLQQLGATFDYMTCFNIGIVVLLMWLILIIGLNAIDVLWFGDAFSIGVMIIIASILHHPFHVNSIVIFNFSVTVSLIRMRFGKANEVLENLTTLPEQQVTLRAWAFTDTKLKALTLKNTTHEISSDCQNRKDVIRIIKQVHLELSSAAKDLNQAYGVQVALLIAADFILLTGNLYNVYILLKSPSIIGQNFQLFVVVVWSITHFLKVMAINQACEHLNTEAQRTGSIIHAIQESIRDPELSEEIEQFSLQMIQDPLFLSPIGFFTLGFPFVLGFLGTVTTYLVILIDMSSLTTHK